MNDEQVQSCADETTVATPADFKAAEFAPSDLPESEPGDRFFEEWNVFRRELGQWIASGLEGQHVLIAGAKVIGFFDSWDDAEREGLRRSLACPFFVKRILAREPVLRVRGLNFPWPAKLIQ